MPLHQRPRIESCRGAAEHYAYARIPMFDALGDCDAQASVGVVHRKTNDGTFVSNDVRCYRIDGARIPAQVLRRRYSLSGERRTEVRDPEMTLESAYIPRGRRKYKENIAPARAHGRLSPRPLHPRSGCGLAREGISSSATQTACCSPSYPMNRDVANAAFWVRLSRRLRGCPTLRLQGRGIFLNVWHYRILLL